MTDERPELKPYAKHVFVCTGGKCTSGEGSRIYQMLKERLRELGCSESGAVLRSQCQCFGICRGGALLVVYPEGIWYDHVTEDKLDRIIREHLLGDRPVREFVFHERHAG